MNWIALMKQNRVSSWIAYEVWCFFEYFNLFRLMPNSFAPYVFGVMMGQKGTRIK